MPETILHPVRGMHRSLPSVFMVEEGGAAYCRVLNNLRPDRGELARRPGMVAVSNMPTRDGLAGTFPVVHFEELNTEPATQPTRFLMITSAEIFLGQPGGWFDITPTYTTGTVSVTNGSATVTGSSTAWLTRGIYGGTSPEGNWFKGPDGTWYNIASVASDTSLTLSTPYGGSTTSGASYTIKRTVRGGRSSLFRFYTARLSQSGGVGPEDLYIAGYVSGGEFTSGVNLADGGVLQVAGAYDGTKTSFAPSDVTFMTSGQNDPSGSADILGYNIQVMGFGALASGNLVLVTQAYDVAGSLAAGARVHWCSLADPAVWTSSPAGSTDIIDYDGAVTGSSFFSTNVSIHFNNGIEIGELQSKSDEPLRFRPSRSRVGALGPKLIQQIPSGRALGGRELYVGSDLRFYTFNGVDSQPVDIAGVEEDLSHVANQGKGPDDKLDVRTGFSYQDGHRGEVAFCFNFEDGGASQKTREIRLGYDSGLAWRAQYPGLLGYAAQLSSSALVGSEAWDSSPVLDTTILTTDTGSSWLWRLSEAASSDAHDPANGDMDGVYVHFDGLSLGKPWEETVLREVLVYCRAPFHATVAEANFDVTVAHQGKAAGEMIQGTVTPTRTAHLSHYRRLEEVVKLSGWTEASFRTLDLTISATDGNTLPLTITRIVLSWAPAADTRAL